MKAKLIALAAMAVSGAALAQSSVTVYGVADVWVGNIKSGAPATRVNKSGLTSGGLSSSRIGFRGTEDLGGGLKANFKIETSVNLDEPKATSLGDREAFVGLSGAFGAVDLGAVDTAYDVVNAKAYTVFDSDFSPEWDKNEKVFQSGLYKATPNNGIRYTSPKMGGFSAAVSYAFGEDKTSTESASSVTAFNVTYSEGPIYAALAYQTEEPKGNGKSDDYTRLAGSYDFGVAKALFTYGKVDFANRNEATEYSLGADIPVASNMTVGIGYATSETENAAGAKLSERSGFGLAVRYSLSKRTTVYGGLSKTKTENNVGTTTSKSDVYGIGIRHTF